MLVQEEVRITREPKEERRLIVLIFGSRKFNEKELPGCYEYLARRCIHVMLGVQGRCISQGFKPDWLIISGGATGADSLAKRFAKDMSYPFVEYLPQFKREGIPYRPEFKRHYYLRDMEMAEACYVGIGFLVKQVGSNKGSRLTITGLLDRHKEIHIFYK